MVERLYRNLGFDAVKFANVCSRYSDKKIKDMTYKERYDIMKEYIIFTIKKLEANIILTEKKLKDSKDQLGYSKIAKDKESVKIFKEKIEKNTIMLEKLNQKLIINNQILENLSDRNIGLMLFEKWTFMFITKERYPNRLIFHNEQNAESYAAVIATSLRYLGATDELIQDVQEKLNNFYATRKNAHYKDKRIEYIENLKKLLNIET